MHLLVFQDSCVTLPWLPILHGFPQSLLLLCWYILDGKPKTSRPLREMKKTKKTELIFNDSLNALGQCYVIIKSCSWFCYSLFMNKIAQSNNIHTWIIHKLGIWLWCCFFWGVGQLAWFRMLTKVIKTLIFCFLASVQGYSSSKVNFSSVLICDPRVLTQSCHLPLRYSNSVISKKI